VASKPLTRFVNKHPTLVVLCLAFLLMIGLSLVAEGLGFHIPKGYLYAAIGFSIMIEFFNQVAQINSARREARRPLRERTAESVLRLLGARPRTGQPVVEPAGDATTPERAAFLVEERNMVRGVLRLAERQARSVMTPRSDVSWVDLDEAPDVIRQQVLDSPHGILPVCHGSLEDVVGVARAKDLLADLMQHGKINETGSLRPPRYVLESTSAIKLIETLRHARGQLALVNDEYGLIKGVLSPIDILEAIAGEFPDEDESLKIQSTGPGQWLVAGSADLHQLEQVLRTFGLVSDDDDYTSLAGFLLARFGRVPQVDEVQSHQGFEFRVTGVDDMRITTVAVRRL